MLHEPEEFGDNWSDELERGDVERIEAYFRRRELVRDDLDFINFRVGGRDNPIRLDGRNGRGLTFEVPRSSLMAAVEHEIFDDLLIGNFMKATLHGVRSLYDAGRFNYATTKWGDGGRAFTRAEVRRYVGEYRRRSGAREWLYSRYFRRPLRGLAGSGWGAAVASSDNPIVAMMLSRLRSL